MTRLKLTTGLLLLLLLVMSACAAPQRQPVPPTTPPTPAQPAPAPGTAATPEVPALPTALRLNALHFVDGGHGWAAGQGVIVATRDGGDNWIRQYTGAAAFDGIGFTDVNHGWASAPDALLRTADAGGHWTATVLPATPLVAATFADPSHGWVITGDRQAGGAIQATTDGGSTWRAQQSPVKVQSICTTGPNTAWAAGGTKVVRTTDGGTTWSTVFTAPVTGSGQWQAAIRCASDATWVLFTDGAAMSHQAYVAFRTAADGATWEPVLAATAAAGAYPSIRVTTGIDAYAGPFDVAKQAAIFLGSCAPCGNGGTSSVTRSMDGGQTWRHNEIPGVRNPVALSIIDAENGWMLARTDGGTQVLSTIDGGVNWKVRRPPALDPAPSTGSSG